MTADNILFKINKIIVRIIIEGFLLKCHHFPP